MLFISIGIVFTTNKQLIDFASSNDEFNEIMEKNSQQPVVTPLEKELKEDDSHPLPSLESQETSPLQEALKKWRHEYNHPLTIINRNSSFVAA